MKKQTILAVALAAMMVIILAGCSTATPAPTTAPAAAASAAPTQTTEVAATTAASDKIINCNYVIPGNAQKDYDVVAAKINEKLAADGTGISLSRTYIPWDAWESKINIMLSTNQPFDLFHVMQDWIPFSTYLANGGVLDITDYVSQYGQNITKNIPANIMSGVTFKGKIYAIPANWIELAGSGFSWRGDLEKEYGLTVPANEDDLLAQMKKASDSWKGKSNKNYFVLSNAADYDPAELSFLFSSYPDYKADPFVVRDKLFMIGQSGTVTPFLESDSFKRAAAFFTKAQDMGLMNPDLLVLQPEQREEITKSGDWLVYLGGDSTRPSDIQKNYPNYTKDDLKGVSFTNDPPIRAITVKNCNAVPVTSVHPEAGVKFLNWLYADQTNYDLYMYGVKDTHYTATGDKTMKTILDSSTSQPLYLADDWMTGNLLYERCSDDMPTVTAKDWYTTKTNAVNSVAASFLFNATPVQAELANVKTIWTSDFVPILLGFVKYDSGYPAALAKMKNAGLDKVVEEYQKQLSAYMAANK